MINVGERPTEMALTQRQRPGNEPRTSPRL